MWRFNNRDYSIVLISSLFLLRSVAALTVAARDWLHFTDRLVFVTFFNLIGEYSGGGGLWRYNPEIQHGPLRLRCHVSLDWVQSSAVPSKKKWVNMTLLCWLMRNCVCNVLTWSLTLFPSSIRSWVWSNTRRYHLDHVMYRDVENAWFVYQVQFWLPNFVVLLELVKNNSTTLPNNQC